jgi:hypothetical protein
MARRRRRRNPFFRRRRAHRAHRRHNPRGYRHHRRRLRNPRRSGGGLGGVNSIIRNAVVPAAMGAGGALALDVVYGYLTPYLPATLQTGWMTVLVKGAAAVGLGMVAMKFLGRERGKVVMLGALTVTAYSALRTATAGMGIPGLSGYSDYTPFPMHGLGAYIRGPTNTPGIQGLGRVGYVSPAGVIGPTMSPRMGAYMPMNVVPAMGDYGDGM